MPSAPTRGRSREDADEKPKAAALNCLAIDKEALSLCGIYFVLYAVCATCMMYVRTRGWLLAVQSLGVWLLGCRCQHNFLSVSKFVNVQRLAVGLCLDNENSDLYGLVYTTFKYYIFAASIAKKK